MCGKNIKNGTHTGIRIPAKSLEGFRAIRYTIRADIFTYISASFNLLLIR